MPSVPLDVATFGGQHHDLGGLPCRRRADALAYLETVQPRHHDVEQHQIGGRTRQRGDRRLAGRGHFNVKSLTFHQEAQRHDDVRLVVDHQHALGHGPIALSRRFAPLCRHLTPVRLCCQVVFVPPVRSHALRAWGASAATSLRRLVAAGGLRQRRRAPPSRAAAPGVAARPAEKADAPQRHISTRSAPTSTLGSSGRVPPSPAPGAAKPSTR